MRFETPLALLLLAFLPLLGANGSLIRRLRFGSRESIGEALRFAAPVELAKLPQSLRQRLREPILRFFLCCSFTMLVLALARPQLGSHFAESLAPARDLMLVLDVSASMEALDFELAGNTVDRLTALKHVTKEFVRQRTTDRIGLILFGSNVFTQAPLTLDHSVVVDFIDSLEIGMVGDGTALGDAVAVGVKRVRDLEAESKALILVTDGMRTAGNLDPIEAAGIAKELGIKIYTIGIGGNGKVPFKGQDPFGRQVTQYLDVPLDAKTLTQIADTTGGKYFHASDTNAMVETYKQIDLLEHREEKTIEYVEYEEKYWPLAVLGLLLLMAYEILNCSVFARIP